MSEAKKLSRSQAIKELWKRGHLSFKLDENQQDLYKLFHDTNHKKQVWLLARRSGKSFALCVLAIEQCVKHPNSIIKFLSPTKLQVNSNLRPIMKKILDDCPDELQPEFREKDYTYYFPNGSELQLAGTESGHAEKLRGSDASICIIDEAGSCTGLENIVNSILLPSTLITKGKVLIAGTPPSEPDHDFIHLIEEAESKGALVKRTVNDNPRITKEQIEELIEELGGPNSDATRRELFCEIIRSADTAVIPEFTPELEAEIVRSWPTPAHYDSYVTMDVGGKDLTALLFAYWDFRNNKLIVQDELIMDFQQKDSTILKLVEDIKSKEEKLWTDPQTQEFKKPYMRISDINYILTNDIAKHSLGEIVFANITQKDKDSAINELRLMLASKKIIIDPKCETLLRHLRNVRWRTNTNKKHFARSPDNGHYDAVDALLFLIRHCVYTRNPYPAGYDYHMSFQGNDYFVQNPVTNNSNTAEVFKKAFKIRNKPYGKR